MSGRTSSIAANMRWRLMDESKYTDGFIWSVGPVFNFSEKHLARTLLLLANFGKERRPEPITTKISQETLAEIIGSINSAASASNRLRPRDRPGQWSFVG